MTKCYICNADIDHPVVDGRDNKILPCGTCMQVIIETSGELDDLDRFKEDPDMMDTPMNIVYDDTNFDVRSEL